METNLFICQQLIESLRGFDKEIKESEKKLRVILACRRDEGPLGNSAQANCAVYNAYLSVYSTRTYFDGIVGLNLSDKMQKNLETVRVIAKKIEDEFSALYKEMKDIPNTESIWEREISSEELTPLLTLCRKQVLLSSYLRQTETLLLVELSGKEPEVFENKYFGEKDVWKDLE